MKESQSKKKRQPALNGEKTTRRELFCCFLALLGNPREAAVQAGYPAASAAREAALLLEEPQVLKSVERLQELQRQKLARHALGGLGRLAFGSINDAASLIMCENPEELPDIEKLDLFMVSELKKTKGGGLEMRFYDRLAALQALLAQHPDDSGNSREGSLYHALEQGAKALKDMEGSHDL